MGVRIVVDPSLREQYKQDRRARTFDGIADSFFKGLQFSQQKENADRQFELQQQQLAQKEALQALQMQDYEASIQFQKAEATRKAEQYERQKAIEQQVLGLGESVMSPMEVSAAQRNLLPPQQKALFDAKIDQKLVSEGDRIVQSLVEQGALGEPGTDDQPNEQLEQLQALRQTNASAYRRTVGEISQKFSAAQLAAAKAEQARQRAAQEVQAAMEMGQLDEIDNEDAYKAAQKYVQAATEGDSRATREARAAFQIATDGGLRAHTAKVAQQAAQQAVAAVVAQQAAQATGMAGAGVTPRRQNGSLPAAGETRTTGRAGEWKKAKAFVDFVQSVKGKPDAQAAMVAYMREQFGRILSMEEIQAMTALARQQRPQGRQIRTEMLPGGWPVEMDVTPPRMPFLGSDGR